MPWPEKDLTTRLLAGVGGSILGALAGFVAVTNKYFTLDSPTHIILYAAGGGAIVGFVLAFWLGDAAVRLLARLVGWVR